MTHDEGAEPGVADAETGVGVTGDVGTDAVVIAGGEQGDGGN